MFERRTQAVVLAAALACGPVAPAEMTAAGVSASTTGSSTAADAGTGPGPTAGEPTTTAPDTLASSDTSTGRTTSTGSDTAGTDPSTGSGTSTGAATTDPVVCIADPAAGICTEGCNHLADCCRCEGRTLAITEPSECKIAAGIVTAFCPWSIDGIRLDGEPQSESSDCADAEAIWMQSPVDGDIVIELCGDTCAAYLDGKFAELRIDMFCHVS